MPQTKFKLLEKIATADIAFEIYGRDLSELFENSALATTSVMVDIKTLKEKIKKTIQLQRKEIERLLFDFLNEIVFLKDAKSLLFKKFQIMVKENKECFTLNAILFGEKINPKEQILKTDIKAVTMHMLKILKKKDKYIATIVLDI